ncbi:MAG: TonB family protein [Sphingobacteriales bacterium]
MRLTKFLKLRKSFFLKWTCKMYIYANLNLIGMIKKAFIFILSIGYCACTFAQGNADFFKKSYIYYLKNTGQLVAQKDSADYIRVISPPDSTDLNLFVVRDFYPDGKPKLIGTSLIPYYYLKRQGIFVEYFPNGHRKQIVSYENNVQEGDVTSYYPNGKFYYTYNFRKDLKQDIITAAGDSTGAKIAENGNGIWIEYDNDFKFVKGKGAILNGLKEGEWRGTPNDSVTYVCTYSKGNSVSGTSHTKSGKEYHFTKDIILPEFKGGMTKFYEFLARSIHYPAVAKENHIQGKVFISFLVEKDGSLSHFTILRGIGAGCDEEVLRVMKLSPPWSPGYRYGIVADQLYNVPIGFALQND